MLVFDIELVSFAPNPTVAPADVAAPPADAKKTKSGLAYKVLTAGTGAVHPKRNSTVTVHYTGWTTDGKTFDSSVARASPLSFPLDGVIPGWTEGVQLMVEGEKTPFLDPAASRVQRPGGHAEGHARVRRRAPDHSKVGQPDAVQYQGRLGLPGGPPLRVSQERS